SPCPTTPASLPRRRPWRSPLFPYTTLFRSRGHRSARGAAASRRVGALRRVVHASRPSRAPAPRSSRASARQTFANSPRPCCCARSEEHTSELQSRFDLVCRLLLEKKKKKHR